MFDFELEKEGELTLLMQESGIVSFNDACRFIANIYYGRNADKTDLATVFHERKGTCSSKHNFLKKLAEEQGVKEVKLYLGYFKMNGSSIPALKDLFANWDLEYIPEAHVYLKVNEDVLDFTKTNPINFSPFLLEEIELTIDEVVSQKENLHKSYLSKWNKTKYTEDELWEMRELCISKLS